MNDTDTALIRDYLDGRIQPEQLDELNLLLETNSEARDLFRHLSLIEEDLQDRTNATLNELSPTIKEVSGPSKRATFQNPIGTAAAGILFGVCSTLFVNKVVTASPSIDNSTELLFEDFETSTTIGHTGLPNATHKWSGDYTELTQDENLIRPYSGKNMLSFKKANYEGKPLDGSYIGDLYHIIDLRQHATLIQNQGTQIDVDMFFNNLPFSKEQDYRASITLIAFDEIPGLKGSNKANMPFLDPIALDGRGIAISKRSMTLSDQGYEWQKLHCDLTLPKESQYLVLRIGVCDIHQYGKRKTPYEFKGQYLDSVQVRLSPTPIL